MFETNFSTYLTKTEGTYQLVPNTSQNWLQVTLRLQTAGVVVIGQNANLQPTTSGQGRVLPVGEDITFTLPPLTTLYIASNTVNRVAVMITPFPWLSQILAAVSAVGRIPGSVVPGQTPPIMPQGAPPANKVDIGNFGFESPMPRTK